MDFFFPKPNSLNRNYNTRTSVQRCCFFCYHFKTVLANIKEKLRFGILCLLNSHNNFLFQVLRKFTFRPMKSFFFFLLFGIKPTYFLMLCKHLNSKKISRREKELELSSTESELEERHEEEKYYEGGNKKTQVMIRSF